MTARVLVVRIYFSVRLYKYTLSRVLPNVAVANRTALERLSRVSTLRFKLHRDGRVAYLPDSPQTLLTYTYPRRKRAAYG